MPSAVGNDEKESEPSALILASPYSPIVDQPETVSSLIGNGLSGCAGSNVFCSASFVGSGAFVASVVGCGASDFTGASADGALVAGAFESTGPGATEVPGAAEEPGAVEAAAEEAGAPEAAAEA